MGVSVRAQPEGHDTAPPDYRLGSVVFAATPGHQGIFDVLVALHVVCALVGFGSVAISGVYGASVRRTGEPNGSGEPDESEEAARYFQSRGWPELLILLVPVFGAAAIAFRPAGAVFGDFWVVAGLVLWALAAGLLVGVVRPAENRIRARGPHPVVRSSGARLMWAAAASDVLFLLALALMITQPA